MINASVILNRETGTKKKDLRSITRRRSFRYYDCRGDLVAAQPDSNSYRNELGIRSTVTKHVVEASFHE